MSNELATINQLNDAVETLVTKSELASFKMDLLEVSKAIQRLDVRDYEDSRAFIGIILKHDRRIKKLEKKVALWKYLKKNTKKT